MRAVPLRLRGLFLVAVCAAWGCRAAASSAGPSPADPPAADREAAGEPTPRELFEARCSTCHSLDLPESQRLDRANWEWVVTDMVEKFGATWITEEEQRILIDYLTENYGPDRSE